VYRGAALRRRPWPTGPGVTLPLVVTESLGGGALARAALEGAVPAEWYESRPKSPEAWMQRVRAVSGAAPASWRERLAPGFGERGAAVERLTNAAAGGAVVTTGQQPGLFGGPLYTLTKALGALALADELEAVTGLPVAPVFWAATDDSDFAEAAWTAVAVAGGFERLELPAPGMDGVSMRDVPLGDVTAALATLERAAASAIDPVPLAAARHAYRSGTTVGQAYLELLRALLEPLGVAVLDASHRAVTSAEHPLLCQALMRGGDVAQALAARTTELHAAGFEPQVPDLPALSLVFARDAQGRRVRVALDRAVDVAQTASPGELGPNVLLRPVAERAILPTVAYVAGPGEFAYFAQVRAVAESLGAAAPLAVPRWSATLIEPHVAGLLARYGLDMVSRRTTFDTPTP
jgi:bacillithiol synthase